MSPPAARASVNTPRQHNFKKTPTNLNRPSITRPPLSLRLSPRQHFKKCIKPLEGHMALLKACGFEQSGSYLKWQWAAAAGAEKDANQEALEVASRSVAEWGDAIAAAKKAGTTVAAESATTPTDSEMRVP